MRGCRHSGVRMIIPSRSTCQPTRVTCRYVKPQRTMHPPQLMEGEALASRVLELGPCSTKFIGPVVMEVPHFASLRGKEREIIILRSDNGETWREHTIDNSEEIIHDVLQQCFEPEGKWEWSLLESHLVYNLNSSLQRLPNWRSRLATMSAALSPTTSLSTSPSYRAYARRSMPLDRRAAWCQAPWCHRCRPSSHREPSPRRSKLAYR